MKDNDNVQNQFPAEEMPPHPESKGKVEERSTYSARESESYSQTENPQREIQQEVVPTESVTDSSASQEATNQSRAVLSDVPVQMQEVQVAKSKDDSKNFPPKKKGFSKKVIFFIGILILAIVGAIVIYFISNQDGIGDLFGNKGEVVWWGIEEDESVIKPLIDEFQEENPDIKIIYSKQSKQDYRVRLTNSLAGGKGPDIFEYHDSWVPMFINELSSIPSEVMSQPEYSQTFYPIIVSDMLTNKGLVGIPLFYDAITLYINEDIFASVAKQPPETWNELSDLVNPESGVLTLSDGRGAIIQSGVALGTTKNVDYWQDILALMMVQNGADLKDPVGSRAIDALNFYKLFSKKGKQVWNESLPDSTIAFSQGKVAMYFGPSREAYNIARANSALRFKTIPLPQLPKNSPTDPDISYATYWVQGVWEKSTNKQAAWKFLKFLSERASIEKLNSVRKTTRNFELASPRMDMAKLYTQNPILSSIVAQAANARSWYLAGKTNDGDTGINSRVGILFEGVVNAKGKPDNELEKMAPELKQILFKYGIKVNITPTVQK